MTLAFANETAVQVGASLRHYADHFDKVGVQAITEDLFRKDRQAPVRASMFAKCPKLASAVARDLVKEEFDDRTKYVFLLAHYAAMMAKVAIRNYMVSPVPGRRWHWKVETEASVTYQSKISGTIDVLLSSKGLPADCRIPVEIKKTSKLRASHVWQTICYMKALQSDAGIVLTLFPGQSSDFCAWTVYRVEDGYQVYLGVNPVPVGEGVSAITFFSDVEFDAMLEQHIAWDLLTNDEILEAPGPYHEEQDMFAEPCARSYEPPDVYKRSGKWGQVGDNKPGSGIVFGLCPLYGKCHLTHLTAAGFPESVTPHVLGVKLVDGIPRVKDYGNA